MQRFYSLEDHQIAPRPTAVGAVVPEEHVERSQLIFAFLMKAHTNGHHCRARAGGTVKLL